MIGELLANPVMAVVIVAIAIILAKILKFGMKIIKWILLIGAAYIIVTALHIF